MLKTFPEIRPYPREFRVVQNVYNGQFEIQFRENSGPFSWLYEPWYYCPIDCFENKDSAFAERDRLIAEDLALVDAPRVPVKR